MNLVSLILAAGRGTRMVGYGSCKALLPLIPSKDSIYEGSRPFILEILERLPHGPKAIVVHHDKERVQEVVKNHLLPDEQPTFIWQPQLNGTGGAVLSSREFLSKASPGFCIITMADVPLICQSTYRSLIGKMMNTGAVGVVLAFRPRDKAHQYGYLITEGHRVKEIVEWKYWKDFDTERKRGLEICNAGVYAFRLETLLLTLPALTERPHKVQKTIKGRMETIEEFFLTDLISLMTDHGFGVTFIEADEEEVLGVDTPYQLKRAQEIYKRRRADLSVCP
ncbi:MAG: NTP transferase domain-containing protein [Syntrophobacterales bacterium]|nr:NTP transferase domain-containing protein [Syntrophobacterales bacterium]